MGRKTTQEKNAIKFVLIVGMDKIEDEMRDFRIATSDFENGQETAFTDSNFFNFDPFFKKLERDLNLTPHGIDHYNGMVGYYPEVAMGYFNDLNKKLKDAVLYIKKKIPY